MEQRWAAGCFCAVVVASQQPAVAGSVNGVLLAGRWFLPYHSPGVTGPLNGVWCSWGDGGPECFQVVG